MSHERDQLRAAWKITTLGPYDPRDFLTSVRDLKTRADRAEGAAEKLAAIRHILDEGEE